MPKSVQQKQQEALARKREAFPKLIAYWCSMSRQGDIYKWRHSIDCEWAEEGFKEAERRLVKAAAEAHVDRHGNPLKKD